MSDPYAFLPASGRKGRWSAFIEPFRSRHFRFHILRRSHDVEANIVFSDPDPVTGQRVSERIVEKAVKFELVEFEEGEWPTDPTISGTYEANDVADFLQAMVDCAYGLGITPTKQKDLEGELAAVRAHLEDMRSLVLRMPIGLFAKPKSESRGEGTDA
jgi:hypothetical protein